jgi:hypothetical protein
VQTNKTAFQNTLPSAFSKSFTYFHKHHDPTLQQTLLQKTIKTKTTVYFSLPVCFLEKKKS